MTRPVVVWLTGLSGSGKTTIAEKLKKNLVARYGAIKLLDGDDIRKTVHSHLAFTPEDIKMNNSLVARWCANHGGGYDIIIVAMISPFAESRDGARRLIGENFVEVYVKASLKEVIRRDVKGLYKDAMCGEIENFVGISPNVPYEEPEKPDLLLDTEKENAETCLKRLADYVRNRCDASGAGFKRSPKSDFA